jgi:hypothetical protein
MPFINSFIYTNVCSVPAVYWDLEQMPEARDNWILVMPSGPMARLDVVGMKQARIWGKKPWDFQAPCAFHVRTLLS